MADAEYNVLFLCVRNATRSIIAERVLDRYGGGRFKGYSAGSAPASEIHPYTLDLLSNQNYAVDGLRPKRWQEFTAADAPHMDFIFAVGDEAVEELSTTWPGEPLTSHWGIPDPADAEGSEAERRYAFADAMRMITQRVDIFVNLPLTAFDKSALQTRLDAIGGRQREGA